MRTLAFVTVHRFYHPWSCDQYYLGELVFTLQQQTIVGISSNSLESQSNGILKGSPLQQSRNPFTTAMLPKPIVRIDGESGLPSIRYPGANSLNQNDKQSFLAFLLQELAQRMDLMAFFHSLCQDLPEHDLHQRDSEVPIVDLCALIVEPICMKLEQVLLSKGSLAIPSALKYTLLALHRGSEGSVDWVRHGPVKRFLAQALTEYLPVYFQQKFKGISNNIHNDASNMMLSDGNYNVMVDRVKDLFYLCFDQDVGKKLQLCLSDTAALSRSKWLITR